MLVAAIFVGAGMLLPLVSAYHNCPCSKLTYASVHPQNGLCESDFVIEGIQVGDREDASAGIGSGRIYTILVKVVYKGGEKIKVGSKIEIITLLESDPCSVHVLPNMLWLLAGHIIDNTGKRIFHIDLCHGWNKEVFSLTPQQRDFLGNFNVETYFGRGNINCKKCIVVRCLDYDCLSAFNGKCVMDNKPCYGETLSCQYNGNECEWMGKEDAEKCFNS